MITFLSFHIARSSYDHIYFLSYITIIFLSFHISRSSYDYVSDDWLKCDDDTVSPVTAEEVLKLSGGGDWHIAYVLLYGPRRLEKKERHAKVATVSSTSPTPMETEAAANGNS